jgi:uncharacterized protein
MQPTYILLTITIIIALFIRNNKFIYVGLLVTSAVAFFEHIINLNSLAVLGVFALLSFCYFNLKNIPSILRAVLFICLMILIAGFILHIVPGFSNALVLNKTTVSKASSAFSMYLNFDKAMAGLILYAFSSLSGAEKNINFKSIWQTVLLLGLCIIVVLPTAILTGHVKLDPKLPQILPLWVINNFLFVCFAEEIIFRGFLQNTIINLYISKNNSVYLPIIIASVVFGLTHFNGGIVFIVLSSISGMFYGYTYYKTNRILCAMLVHFGLNLFHLLLFTYPAAIKG